MSKENIGLKPLQVNKIFIQGNQYTSNRFLEQECSVFQGCETVQDVLFASQKLSSHLEGLGVFEKVQIRLNPTENRDAGRTDVVVLVDELRWLSGGTGVEADDNIQGSANINAVVRNIFGRADITTVKFGIKTDKTPVYQVVSSHRNLLGTGLSFRISGISDDIDRTWCSSYQENQKGLILSLIGGSGRHELSYNLMRREIHPQKNNEILLASKEIQDLENLNVKSSISYTFTNDHRDDPITPTNGSLFRTILESAGIIGDCEFVKGEVTVQKHTALGSLLARPEQNIRGLSFGLGLNLGVLYNFTRSFQDGSKLPSFIADRFFLGGINSVRGFENNMIGPKAMNFKECKDALGGDVKYVCSAVVSSPFPASAIALAGGRLNFFLNAGNVAFLDTTPTQFLKDSRITAGVGFVVPLFNMCRLEVNFSRVLRKLEDDRPKNFQIGLGFNF